MAKDKKTIEFDAKNVKAFTAWLKRFSSIDNSLLLEIDQVKLTFIAKTYNDSRSVVKMSSISFDDAGFTTKISKDLKRIKIGIYNILRLIKIMDQFADVEFVLTVEYGEIINEKVAEKVAEKVIEYAAEKLLLRSKLLKMNVDCTSLNIFKYISDELFTNSIAAVDTLVSFELSKANLEKINILNNLDETDEQCMQFIITEGKILATGKTYEWVINETTTNKPLALSIFKDQYGTLDVENYDANMGDDRIVFKSKDSDTVVVISKAETK